MSANMQTSQCPRCSGPKRPRSRGCQKCSKIISRERRRDKAAAAARAAYKANPQKQANRVKDWLRANPNWRRDYSARYKLKQLENAPQKLRAKNAVTAAIRDGKMTKKPCQICGKIIVDAHHNSYAQSEWLIVTWLCRAHHRAWHRVFIADFSEAKTEEVE